jgi:predicted aspartyl protease
MGNNGDSEMGRISVQVELANNLDVLKFEAGEISADQVRRVAVQGIVDSGASRLVVPQAVVDQLQLPKTGETTVRYADQRTAKRALVKSVWLQLAGRQGDFTAVVEPNRTDALVGALVLEDLDLIVDCGRQSVTPRDPTGIVSEIE